MQLKTVPSEKIANQLKANAEAQGKVVEIKKVGGKFQVKIMDPAPVETPEQIADAPAENVADQQSAAVVADLPTSVDGIDITPVVVEPTADTDDQPLATKIDEGVPGMIAAETNEPAPVAVNANEAITMFFKGAKLRPVYVITEPVGSGPKGPVSRWIERAHCKSVEAKDGGVYVTALPKVFSSRGIPLAQKKEAATA